MTKNRVIISVSVTLALLIVAGSVIAGMSRVTNSPEQLISLGEKYLSELNYEQALVQFLKVIEIEPMNERAYLGAAEAYIGLGQTDKAIEVLAQGLLVFTDSESISIKLEELRSGLYSEIASELHEEAIAEYTSTNPNLTVEQIAMLNRMMDAFLVKDVDLAYEILGTDDFKQMMADAPQFGDQNDSNDLVYSMLTTFYYEYNSIEMQLLYESYYFETNGGATDVWDVSITRMQEGTYLTRIFKETLLDRVETIHTIAHCIDGIVNGSFEHVEVFASNEQYNRSVFYGSAVDGLIDGAAVQEKEDQWEDGSKYFTKFYYNFDNGIIIPVPLDSVNPEEQFRAKSNMESHGEFIGGLTEGSNYPAMMRPDNTPQVFDFKEEFRLLTPRVSHSYPPGSYR